MYIAYFTFHKSVTNAEKICADFNNVTSFKCDFKDFQQLTSLIDTINQLDLDVLVNNAYNGYFLTSHFHKISSDHILDDFKDNIIPTIKITQSAINSFRKKKSGKIITILTSALVNVPPIGSSIYVANKAYLEKLTKVWANENIKFNISSNSISPSFMMTNLTADTDERILEQITGSHPLKKMLSVGEVAEAVFFFTRASPHINGVDLVINAGMHLR